MRETCIKCGIQVSPTIYIFEFKHDSYIVYVCRECLTKYEPMTKVVHAERRDIPSVQGRDATLGIRRKSDQPESGESDSDELQASRAGRGQDQGEDDTEE